MKAEDKLTLISWAEINADNLAAGFVKKNFVH
jgi:hypothetical protein